MSSSVSLNLILFCSSYLTFQLTETASTNKLKNSARWTKRKLSEQWGESHTVCTGNSWYANTKCGIYSCFDAHYISHLTLEPQKKSVIYTVNEKMMKQTKYWVLSRRSWWDVIGVCLTQRIKSITLDSTNDSCCNHTAVMLLYDNRLTAPTH